MNAIHINRNTSLRAGIFFNQNFSERYLNNKFVTLNDSRIRDVDNELDGTSRG